MLVETQLGKHALHAEMRIVSHKKIVFDNQETGCILAAFPPDLTLGFEHYYANTLNTRAMGGPHPARRLHWHCAMEAVDGRYQPRSTARRRCTGPEQP